MCQNSETPRGSFGFSFLCNFTFYLMNALVYVVIDQGIHKVSAKDLFLISAIESNNLHLFLASHYYFRRIK